MCIFRHASGSAINTTKRKGIFLHLLFRGLLFGLGAHPLQLGGAQLFPAGKAFGVRHLGAAGKAPVQAVPAGQLVPLEHALPGGVAAAGAAGALTQGIPCLLYTSDAADEL